MVSPPHALESAARLLIGGGLLAVAVGGCLLLAGKLPWIGQLPGDLVIQRDRFTVYAPIATSLVISVVATIALNLIFRR